VYEDAAYARWANDKTIHVMSYYIAPEDQAAELTKEVERDGEKVSVLVAYPDFTKDDMESLMRGIDSKLTIPEKTPWAGVISPDGKTVLAQKMGKATAKEFRELYETEAKKLGPVLPRETWTKACAALAKSTEAEADNRWKDAVAAVVEMRPSLESFPKALRDRFAGQIEALEAARDRMRDEAQKLPEKKRAEALAKVDADFGPLSAPVAPPTKPK
jgi:hypothetical protein